MSKPFYKPFYPQPGQQYFVIETTVKSKKVFWTGKSAISEKAIRRDNNDIWGWTTDIFKARCFKTQKEALQCNEELNLGEFIKAYVNYQGKAV
jgi:hypothetical protein